MKRRVAMMMVMMLLAAVVLPVLVGSALMADDVVLVNGTPKLIRVNINSPDATNGVKVTLGRFDKPFTPTKIVSAAALPESGTVFVRRSRAGVVETVGGLTNVSGSATAKATPLVVLYAYDNLMINVEEGSVTNGVVEIHGIEH